MLSDIADNCEEIKSTIKRFPSKDETHQGLSDSTLIALKEAVAIYQSQSKLIRTSKYEIPLKLNNYNQGYNQGYNQQLELEFTLLGLYKTKDNGDDFTKEEWINILKENTPSSSKYLWDLLDLEECVLDNGRFDKSLINQKLQF
jgi:hypothetical protein